MAELVVNLCRPMEQYKLNNQQRLTNRQRDQQGSAVSDLLRDPDRPSTASSTSHQNVHDLEPVKNYAQQNRKLLHQLAVHQKEKALAQQISERSPKVISTRYDNVSSKVFLETESSSEKKPLRTEYLRAHSKTGPNSDIFSRPSSNVSPSRSSVSLSSVPSSSRYPSSRIHSASTTASCSTLTGSREQPNYVRLNGQNAKEPKQMVGNQSFIERQTGFLQKLEKLPKTPVGQVPIYLLKRQEEWKDDERMIVERAQQAKIPKGCQLMGEEERQELIEQLHSTKAEKEQEMQRLPIRNDTMRARNKRRELEEVLSKIDDHLELLSKPKVYIPIRHY